MEQSDLDTFRWRLEESRTQLGISRPRLCLVNPAVLHSIQLLSPLYSINSADLVEKGAPEDDELDATLLPLVGSVELLDQKIHSEIVDREFDHALLSVQLLSPDSSRKAELIVQQIMRYKILESIAWATVDVGSIPIQQLPTFQVNSADQELVELGLTQWKETVNLFCTTFHAERGVRPQELKISKDNIIASLVRKIQQSETSRHHSTVVSNMCGAALGLRGLILLGKSFFSANVSGNDSKGITGGSFPDVSTLMNMDINGEGGLASDWALSFFGGQSDFHILRPLYTAAVFSPIILLSQKHLVVRRRTTIQLQAMYNGLFQSWGDWSSYRIIVTRDLWLALWRLAREGGDECHAILTQLATKWNNMREQHPDLDLTIESDARLVEILSKHVSLSTHFASSLETVFARSQGLRKTRRSREQMELDSLHALDGNSSLKMDEVWALWENKFVQAKISPVRPTRQEVLCNKWAWYKRAPSCPPLHRSFRQQLLKPLDCTYVVPDLHPREREKYIFHPFTAEERTILRPYHNPDDEITPDMDSYLPTSGQPLQKPNKTLDASLPQPPSLSKVPAKKTGGGRNWGGSYPKARARLAPGIRAATTNAGPSTPSNSTTSAVGIQKIEDNQSTVLPHPVWDIVDVDVGPHPDNSLVAGVTLVFGTDDLPFNLSVQFYSGMHTDLRRTLTILHAVIRGQSVAGFKANSAQREFDLRKSNLYGIAVVSQEDWTGKTIKEQRQTFSVKDVLVVGTPLIDVLPNVSSLSSIEELSLVVDLDRPLLYHTLLRPIGEGLGYRNRKSSINTFLSILDSNRAAALDGHPQTRTVLSFWLVPLNSALVRCPTSFVCLSDGMTVLDDRPASFSWATIVPSSLGTWAHMSHASAVTVTRHDYGGVCTWLHVAVGELLCFVASNRDGKKGAGELFKAGLTPGGVVDEDRLLWTCLRITAGNDLYLRPGSLYHIITIADTIGVGGHFFSASHFTRTLETVIVEHFHVDDSADPEQSRVHIALFKVLRKYVEGISSNLRLPNARQFASLIILCAILNQLPPKTNPARKKVPVWAETAGFAIDHGFALTYVIKIASLLRPMDTYQKRRIVHRMRLQWRLCQELHKWCVASFGPTTTFRDMDKVLLDTPNALEDLLAPSGDVSAALNANVDGERGELSFFE